jgi:hypothetical protein
MINSPLMAKNENTHVEFVAFSMIFNEIFIGVLTKEEALAKIVEDFGCDTAYIINLHLTKEYPTNPNAAHLSRAIPDKYTSAHHERHGGFTSKNS